MVSDDLDKSRMTFTEHLAELRVRIIRAGSAMLIGFLICYAFSNTLIELIARPLLQYAEKVTAAQKLEPQSPPDAANPVAANAAPRFVTLTPFEPIAVALKLSTYGGLALAMPFIAYQLCAFIFPGLTKRERKLVIILLVGCGSLVIAGVLVAYFGVFPLVLPYLSMWKPEFVETQFRMSETLSQLLLGLFGFAITFQFPMVALVLVYVGLLTPETLRNNRRVAIVGIAILSAVFTPPDPVSMMIMMIPLVVLYEASIWISYLVIRNKNKTAKTDAGSNSRDISPHV